MARWPEYAISAIRLDSLLMDEVSIMLAVSSIESYFSAARIQKKRIGKAIAKLNRGTGVQDSNLHSEVHFYLVCVSRIASFARFVAGCTRFPRVARVLKRHRKILDASVKMRNHLEHIEERFPGGNKRSRLVAPGDLFNTWGTTMSFGGEPLEFGPSHTDAIRTFVSEFRRALLYDKIESMAEADPDRLAVLLRRDAGR